MTRHFSDLPTDAMLEVFRYLPIPDLIHILLTCSSIYSVSHRRSFWISTLHTIRAASPIGCPKYADLSRYELQDLKDLVASQFKLQKNWSREVPQVTHPIAVASFKERADMVCLVQGTDIMLLHMRQSGHVVCWDVKLATSFPFPPIKTGAQINDVSTPCEWSYGVCSFLLIAQGDTARRTVWRHIITIRYENRKAIGFEGVCVEVADPICHFECIFLTKDIVGAVTVDEFGDQCTIAASKINGGSVGHLKLAHPISDLHLMVAFTYQGHLFNVLEDGVTAQIQHVSRKSLLSGHYEQTGLYNADILDVGDTSEPLYYTLPSCASYGVAVAFVRSISDTETGKIMTTFTFLPTTLAAADGRRRRPEDDGVSSPLEFNLPCPTGRIVGRLRSSPLLWMDHSGSNVVAVIDDPDSEFLPTLVLVRYHPETASVTLHLPDVHLTPSELYWVTNVCVDDTAGAIYLMGQEFASEWRIWTARYV